MYSICVRKNVNLKIFRLFTCFQAYRKHVFRRVVNKHDTRALTHFTVDSMIYNAEKQTVTIWTINRGLIYVSRNQIVSTNSKHSVVLLDLKPYPSTCVSI